MAYVIMGCVVMALPDGVEAADPAEREDRVVADPVDLVVADVVRYS